MIVNLLAEIACERQEIGEIDVSIPIEVADQTARCTAISAGVQFRRPPQESTLIPGLRNPVAFDINIASASFVRLDLISAFRGT